MSETLIYSMSSKGSMRMDQFNQLFRVTCSPAIYGVEETVDVDVKHHVVHLLDSLGYCEFDFNNRMVYMCAPCLVLLPNFGVPKAVLVGARAPSFIKKLKSIVKQFSGKALITHISQSSVNVSMPACICIEAIDIETIQEIARLSNIDSYLSRPAAWELVNFSDSLDDIMISLKFEVREEPHWKKRTFKTDALVFSGSIERDRGNFSLVEYRNPIDQQLRHWLWNDNSASEIGRYWGRYAVLASKKISVLMYDKRLQKLAVPATVPLPCILARAVAMCSGIIPTTVTLGETVGSIPEGLSLYLYSGVPVFIADVLAAKLKQKISYSSLSLDKAGVLYA